MPFRINPIWWNLPILAALYLCACAPEVRPTADAASGPKRWSAFPVPVYVSDEIHASSELQSEVAEAAQFWNQAAGIELFRLEGAHHAPGTLSWEELPVNLLRFAEEWPWPAHEKGRTLVISQGGAITRSVVAFQRHESWCHSHCEFPGSVRFLTLAAHEMGHMFGMSHREEKGNLMNPVVRQDLQLNEMTIDLPELRSLTRNI